MIPPFERFLTVLRDNLAAFPATGEEGYIYFANDTGTPYRWKGGKYVPWEIPIDTLRPYKPHILSPIDGDVDFYVACPCPRVAYGAKNIPVPVSRPCPIVGANSVDTLLVHIIRYQHPRRR